MEFKPTVCIYHAGCMDGFTAAYQVRQRFDHEMRLIEAAYGDAPPYGDIKPEDDVIIVDFSYPEDQLREIARRSRRVLVLDHHKTAQEALARMPQITRPDAATVHREFDLLRQQDEPVVSNNLLVHFDMNHSGARLTWDFCWGDQRPTRLVDYVEDRDLWKFDLAETRSIHLFLSTCGQLTQVWAEIEELLESNPREIVFRGNAMLAYHDQLVDQIVEATGSLKPFFAFENVAVGAAPPSLASDVGHELLHAYPEAQFAAVMVIQSDKVTWSLRSEDSRKDVSEVAKLFGGGGHRNAAGFRADG